MHKRGIAQQPPAMIDPAALLEPVPGDLPQGNDPRNPNMVPALADLRRAWSLVRQRHDRGETDTQADWADVERQATAILTDVSKDLQVAAFLSEALVYTGGFAGLAEGGLLIAGLLDHFWDTLYPGPDEDEPDAAAARIDPLSFLADGNGRLLPTVRRVALFVLDDGTAFTYPDCQASKSWTALRPEQRSQQLGQLPPQQRAEREQMAGYRLWDTVCQTVRAAPAGTMIALKHDIGAAIDAWRDAGAAVDSHFGEGRFVVRPLLELLRDVLRTVEELVPAMPADEEPPSVETEQNVPVSAAPAAPPRRLDTREDALRQLGEIEAFFRRTEPFSPIAYTLAEATRRATLSWPELLEEMVPNKQQRDEIFTRLGINPNMGAG